MNRIRDLRKAKNMVLKDLAEILNITVQSLSYYELERRQLDPTTLKKLADYFNVTIDYLLGRTDDGAALAPSVNPESTTIPFISNEDKHILELYHSMDSWSKRKFNTILESFAADDTTKKPGELPG